MDGEESDAAGKSDPAHLRTLATKTPIDPDQGTLGCTYVGPIHEHWDDTQLPCLSG